MGDLYKKKLSLSTRRRFSWYQRAFRPGDKLDIFSRPMYRPAAIVWARRRERKGFMDITGLVVCGKDCIKGGGEGDPKENYV
jgi:hypothetical protein